MFKTIFAELRSISCFYDECKSYKSIILNEFQKNNENKIFQFCFIFKIKSFSPKLMRYKTYLGFFLIQSKNLILKIFLMTV